MDKEANTVLCTFVAPSVWEFNFPGASAKVAPDRIPAEILEFIIRDRLNNKLKDVFADSSRVPLQDRQKAVDEIVNRLYAGEWTGRTGGPITWDAYLAKAAKLAAEAWFGKSRTKKDAKGIVRNADSDKDKDYVAGRHMANDVWLAKVRNEYDIYVARKNAAKIEVEI